MGPPSRTAISTPYKCLRGELVITGEERELLDRFAQATAGWKFRLTHPHTGVEVLGNFRNGTPRYPHQKIVLKADGSRAETNDLVLDIQLTNVPNVLRSDPGAQRS